MLRYLPEAAQRPLIIIGYFWLLSAANDVAIGIGFVGWHLDVELSFCRVYNSIE